MPLEGIQPLATTKLVIGLEVSDMRNHTLAMLVAALLGLVLTAPAEARPRGTYASIASVEPELVAIGTDDYGVYCEYRAEVTLSWAGSIRLRVGQLVDGEQNAPSEVYLSGSGNDVTVVVSGITARRGDEGPVLARAVVQSKRTLTEIDAKASDTPVTCDVPD